MALMDFEAFSGLGSMLWQNSLSQQQLNNSYANDHSAAFAQTFQTSIHQGAYYNPQSDMFVKMCAGPVTPPVVVHDDISWLRKRVAETCWHG